MHDKILDNLPKFQSKCIRVEQKCSRGHNGSPPPSWIGLTYFTAIYKFIGKGQFIKGYRCTHKFIVAEGAESALTLESLGFED